MACPDAASATPNVTSAAAINKAVLVECTHSVMAIRGCNAAWAGAQAIEPRRLRGETEALPLFVRLDVQARADKLRGDLADCDLHDAIELHLRHIGALVFDGMEPH